MDTPRTNDKLEEARFFLGHLHSDDHTVTRATPESFRYYLSAFLSAARSVTFVLQNEAKAAYDAWYPSWENGLPLEDRELLSFMNTQRVAEVHKRGAAILRKDRVIPVRPRATAESNWWSVAAMSQMMNTPAPLINEAGRPEGSAIGHPPWGAWVYVPDFYFEVAGEPAPVLEACDRYFSLLERLVTAFQAAAHGDGEQKEPAGHG